MMKKKKNHKSCCWGCIISLKSGGYAEPKLIALPTQLAAVWSSNKSQASAKNKQRFLSFMVFEVKNLFTFSFGSSSLFSICTNVINDESDGSSKGKINTLFACLCFSRACHVP